MARLTPEEFQEKQARRLKGATADIQRGIERTTVAPGKKAAAKVDKMRTNINKALDDGSWAAKVGAVGLDEWKQKAIQKGIGRIAAGIDASKDKTIQMAARLLAGVDSAKAKVDAMPDASIEDSIARMTTFAREMNKLKGKI